MSVLTTVATHQVTFRLHTSFVQPGSSLDSNIDVALLVAPVIAPTPVRPCGLLVYSDCRKDSHLVGASYKLHLELSRRMEWLQLLLHIPHRLPMLSSDHWKSLSTDCWLTGTIFGCVPDFTPRPSAGPPSASISPRFLTPVVHNLWCFTFDYHGHIFANA